MPKQTKPEWKTTDGKMFPIEKEAQQHEVLVEAEGAYESARRHYATVLTATQKTADGVHFELSCWTYYYIQRGIGRPRIEEVFCSVWNTALNEADKLEIIRYPDYDEIKQGYTVRKYRIQELFAVRKNAERERIKLLAEHVEDLKEELAKLKEEHKVD